MANKDGNQEASSKKGGTLPANIGRPVTAVFPRQGSPLDVAEPKQQHYPRERGFLPLMVTTVGSLDPGRNVMIEVDPRTGLPIMPEPEPEEVPEEKNKAKKKKAKKKAAPEEAPEGEEQLGG